MWSYIENYLHTLLQNSLFSNNLLQIIDSCYEQTATQLFDGYKNISTNYITGKYVFHYIAIDIIDLRILLSFFDKFKL